MGIFHIDIVQASTDIMIPFHVRLNLQTAVGADGQRLVCESHLVEVGLGEVAADSAFYFTRIEQQVCAEAAFEDVVVARDVSLSTTILHIDGGSQIIKVPLTVLQGQDLGIGSQTTLGRQKVQAIA